MKKNKPSRTAAKVAFNLLALSVKPGMKDLMPAGMIETTERLMVASGAARERTVRWAQSQRMVSVYEWFDWMLPGQFEAFAYRKAFCEKQTLAGIGEGAGQVLVLGAGYDTLSLRLAPEFPGVTFFEIDHPPTAARKAKGVRSMGRPPNLFLIAEDLGRRGLEEVLGSQAAWDRNAKTVIVAEGLLMYLPPDAVRQLLIRCARIVGGGSRLVFSYIPSGPDGRLDAGRWTGLMLWLQNLSGEPWLWSVRPKELGAFLAEAGWREAPEINESTGKYGVEYLVAAVKAAKDSVCPGRERT